MASNTEASGEIVQTPCVLFSINCSMLAPDAVRLSADRESRPWFVIESSHQCAMHQPALNGRHSFNVIIRSRRGSDAADQPKQRIGVHVPWATRRVRCCRWVKRETSVPLRQRVNVP